MPLGLIPTTHEVQDICGRISILQSEGEYQPFHTNGSGVERLYRPEMVIGQTPIRQFVIPYPKGRQQVYSLAWDPAEKEWFNVFGDEERNPDEWGHWSQRGMNWNSRCAYCHMTFFEKGYQPKDDSYASSWIEHGVSCLQCHGSMESHAVAATKPGYRGEVLSASQIMDYCASFHREELTGQFKVGDSFHDHFRLTLPTHPDLYYPDGQIRTGMVQSQPPLRSTGEAR